MALALVVALGFYAAHWTSTTARTSDATMSMTVSSGQLFCSGSSSCTVPLANPFTLRISVDTAPSEGYIFLQTEVDYSGLATSGGSYLPTATASDEIVWPDATLAVRSPSFPTGSEGLINHGDTTGIVSFPQSTHEGPIVELTMMCGSSPSSSTIALVPFNASTNTNASGFVTYPIETAETIPAKASPLKVICGFGPGPLDTDGDGCRDSAEMQTAIGSEMFGGRRDHLNPYDFYDTNGDRQIDFVNDIVAVALLFGADADNDPPGEPDGYVAALDRSPPPPGGDPWDMQAPDGQIDLVTDIFGVAFQFGHNCS